MAPQMSIPMQKHAYNPVHLVGGQPECLEIHRLPKILYINRAVRTDRRQFLEQQLKSLNLSFERADAPTPAEAHGFFNRATRGNFLSHLELIERIAREAREYIVLEDDVQIRSPQQMMRNIAYVRREEWACLYFYGASSLRRIHHTADVHAYLMNPSWAPIAAKALRDRYASLSIAGPKNASTCIDQYIAHDLQQRLPFWGMSACVVQNRNKFGSDTGWGYRGKSRKE